MTKAQAERLWLLDRWYGRGGWTRHPWVGTKKWDAHAAKLVRDGLLEDGDYGLQRITPKGEAALSNKEGT